MQPKASTRLAAVLKITRVQTPLYAFAGVIIVSWLADQGISWPSSHAIWGGLMMGCVFAFGNCSNDLFDLDTDVYTNADRPLLTGALSSREVIALSISLAGLSVTFGLLAPWPSVFVGVFGLLLVSLYNLWLKKVLLLSNLVIGLWGVLPIVLVGVMEQTWHWKMTLVIGTLFCLLTGNEILADLPDREGDAAQGRVTIATAFGEKSAFSLGIGIVSLAFPIMNAGAFHLRAPGWYYLAFWVVFFPVTTSFGLRLAQAGDDFEKTHASNWVIAVAFLVLVTVLAISQ